MAEDLAGQIRARLLELGPLELKIEDQSAAHAGHTGALAGAHFRVLMVCAAFRGLSRLERHRLIYQQLASLMGGRIHALTMSLYAPGEAQGEEPAQPH